MRDKDFRALAHNLVMKYCAPDSFSGSDTIEQSEPHAMDRTLFVIEQKWARIAAFARKDKVIPSKDIGQLCYFLVYLHILIEERSATRRNRSTIVRMFLKDSLDMGNRKGKEYARHNDRLANFKQVATYFGVPRSIGLLIYAYKHLTSVRYFVHASDKDRLEVTEPIAGRIIDLFNYMLLLHALEMEKLGCVRAEFLEDD